MNTESICEAEQMPLDRISRLPQPILDTILCLLPTTEEAARTSVLSRDWRYKWTTIPKLRFDFRKGNQMSVSELLSDIGSAMKDVDIHDVHQVVLRHQGPIHEFTLVVQGDHDCFEYEQIILCLSRNHTVKKLMLNSPVNTCWYKVPISLFSMHHLTHLDLREFDLDHPPTFNGFGSLRRLSLIYVRISTKALLHLLSNCPSLKTLSLFIDQSVDTCTINDLLKCLPMIEGLAISGDVSKWLVLDSVPERLPTSLAHLKRLSLVKNYTLAYHVLINSATNLDSFEVQRTLLLHQGPICELTLKLPDHDCLGLSKIVSHLARNYMVKKLTISGCCIEVPMYLFSFHHLTHLDISYLDLYYPPTFQGFRSLESLCLRFVGISKKTLLHLLSDCPSLKTLILFICALDDECTVNELFECLPMVEHLTTWPDVSAWVVLDSFPQELPTSLIRLRYLCIKEMTFVEHCGLAFLFAFIKCSPNVEKIELEIERGIKCYGECSFALEDYSDVWLEHLNELEIKRFNNSKREMDFVKFILARSPKLKKVTIHCVRLVGNQIESEMEILKSLLQAPCVSLVVITVE